MSSARFTTNSTINTRVYGLNDGESINKVELVWIQIGVDDGGADLEIKTNLEIAATNAMGAGRGLILIAGTNDLSIANLQTSTGLNTNVGVLIPGTTYLPAIRWTKNTLTGIIKVGSWTKGSAVIYNNL